MADNPEGAPSRAELDEAIRQALPDASAARREALAAYCAGSFGPDGGAPSPAILVEMVREAARVEGSLDPAALRTNLASLRTRAIARRRALAATPPRHLRRPRGADDLAPGPVTQPYTGFFAVEVHRLRHRRFDGAMSPEIERGVFASGDAVTVLPWDPRSDRVLLIEQFRAGPYARGDRNPWCLEAVAGRADAEEAPEATARREAEEEAGLAIGRLARVLAYYPTPAIASEHITSFVGEADLSHAAEGIFGLAIEHEDIRAFAVPRAEAEAALEAGEIDNAPLALSLLWLAANAGRLAREWAA